MTNRSTFRIVSALLCLTAFPTAAADNLVETDYDGPGGGIIEGLDDNPIIEQICKTIHGYTSDQGSWNGDPIGNTNNQGDNGVFVFVDNPTGPGWTEAGVCLG